MKSRLLKEMRLSKIQRRRIGTLSKLDKKSRTALTNYIKSIDELPIFTKETLRNISDKVGLSADEVYDAISAIRTLAWGVTKCEDSFGDVVSDLKTIDVIKEDQVDALVSILSSLSEKCSALFEKERKLESIYDGALGLTRTNASVCMKPVFKERYSYDKQKVTEYEPHLMGFVPAVQIKLTAEDDASNETFVTFQVSEEVLDRFISDLLSLQKELRIMKNELHLT